MCSINSRKKAICHIEPTTRITNSTPHPSRKPATNLQKITKYTSHEHERIDPYALPPWRRTISLFPNRFTTNPPDPNSDPAKARDKHNKRISEYKEDPNTLYIYTDGSKINRAGFFRVGAGAAAYHEGREVATGRLGLGGHAEVFDAEMAALNIQPADFHGEWNYTIAPRQPDG